MRLALDNYLLHNPGAATRNTFTLSDLQMNALFIDEARIREGKVAGIVSAAAFASTEIVISFRGIDGPSMPDGLTSLGPVDVTSVGR